MGQMILSVKTKYDRRKMNRMVNRAVAVLRKARRAHKVHGEKLDVILHEEAEGFVVWLEYNKTNKQDVTWPVICWLGVVKAVVTVNGAVLSGVATPS